MLLFKNMYIDCHVHCRDFNQKHKETIVHALEVAEKVGLSAIFDMPNTDPPTITEKEVFERLSKADSPVFYGVYVGLTSDREQITEAVKICNKWFPRESDKKGVVGLKMFAGKSVGDLTVSEEKEQKKVYEELAKQNYKGVLVVHCEKEKEMRSQLWDPQEPCTWDRARPQKAETESIKDQIKFALSSDYKGKLHIPHVSSPSSIELIEEKRQFLNLSCGVTPHHLLFNHDTVKNSDQGILYKVNPPIRDRSSQELLLKKFKEGKIDVLETDHAPHTLEEKLKDHASGIPGLSFWPVFVKILKEKGVSEELLEKVAFENINEIFGMKIKKLNRKPEILEKEYSFNLYKNGEDKIRE